MCSLVVGMMKYNMLELLTFLGWLLMVLQASRAEGTDLLHEDP